MQTQGAFFHDWLIVAITATVVGFPALVIGRWRRESGEPHIATAAA